MYPGVGWIVWRDAGALPEDLIFWVNYLGDNMPTFALNFSRPGAQVVAQYYNFLRLGFDGYRPGAGVRPRRSRPACRARSRSSGRSALHHPGRRAARVRVHARRTTSTTSRCSTSRTRCASAAGCVPAYTFPANRTDLAALRVVVRRGFTHDMATLLMKDMQRQLPRLLKQTSPVHDAESGSGFRH